MSACEHQSRPWGRRYGKFGHLGLAARIVGSLMISGGKTGWSLEAWPVCPCLYEPVNEELEVYNLGRPIIDGRAKSLRGNVWLVKKGWS